MPSTRKQTIASIPLRQPDRSAPPDPTLLGLAHQRNLFEQAAARQAQLARETHPRGTPRRAERILEASLWTASIAMLHFTFDVLVQHQYGREIHWAAVWARAARAWSVFLFLFYFLHAREPADVLVPGVAARHQRRLRLALFFAASVAAGCYLIHISNTYGYLATMKQAPPLGCLWLWAVVELDLAWGCASLLVAALFLHLGGYRLR
ncbi:uncharacterized protein UV8b_07858 [Ustilaginoidea virens]|uniref:DUF7719 domain-containing protein n=1 Tax=Ustilaginoidea virens TaxID=1159556 RepID=A0A8E5MLE0_USTVR|nr:uncharacterized protein UV8b_07858 [Ustilaginoidea virens]QUC23617.1 hypothetical protein UV8b_07858 [Ustilaginoidea virens]